MAKIWEGKPKGDGRRFGALSRLDIPGHVLWATEDPVAVLAIGQRLAEIIPSCRATWLEGLGHYPMLEDPERWARAVLDALPA